MCQLWIPTTPGDREISGSNEMGGALTGRFRPEAEVSKLNPKRKLAAERYIIGSAIPATSTLWGDWQRRVLLPSRSSALQVRQILPYA